MKQPGNSAATNGPGGSMSGSGKTRTSAVPRIATMRGRLSMRPTMRPAVIPSRLRNANQPTARPHSGHFDAVFDTSFPQSGHLVSGVGWILGRLVRWFDIDLDTVYP